MMIRATGSSSSSIDYDPIVDNPEDAVNLMTMRQAHANQDNARANRAAAREQAEHESEQEIQALRQEADARMASGLVGATVHLGQAGGSFGQASAEARPGTTDAERGQNSAAISRWKGGNELIQGVGQLVTAGVDRVASEASIRAKRHARSAERSREFASDARDAAQEAGQQAQRAMDRVGQNIQTRAQTANAIASNIRA